jgi:succinoglycan biosynthesis protein ExoO
MTRPTPAGVNVCLISRQRITGRTNGSSVYVLGIAEHLTAQGYKVHYLSPSPATFGRWPVIALRPEMAVFASIRIRGSLKLGRFLVVTDPRAAWRAGMAVLGKLFGRPGQPAPYAVSVPLTAKDSAYLARHAPPLADAILCDYAFLTPAIAAVGRPEAPSLVIMHDLFSARASQFGKLGSKDSVATISQAEEMRLLAKADLVLAIQDEEAAVVRSRLPAQAVAVVPCAVTPKDAAHPGEADRLLFVGSKTAPNVDGLRWFLDTVWPTIRGRRPSARLTVAGSVCAEMAPPPAGVEYLGVVPDLDPLYRRAGVVISPLRAGSGLKIKLIEALAWGKAVVATSATAQGVRSLLQGVVPIVDEPEAFAAEILALMDDDGARLGQAQAALRLARHNFSAEACYRPITDFLGCTMVRRAAAAAEPQNAL